MGKATMIGHADMLANILSTYDAATDSQRARGERWYARMNRLARLHADRLGLDTRHVAGVYAAWSINNGWRNNLRQASAMLHGREARGLGMSMRKAQACMRGEALHIADAQARKVHAFAANMSGDFGRVTVDRWALRVAYGLTDGGYVPKGAEYDAIEAAYVEAAFTRGVAPAVMQAVTWVTLRDAS